jgi:hypothetical protein
MFKLKFASITFFMLSLTACGGGGGGSSTATTFSSWQSITYPSSVSASGVAFEGTYNYNTSTGVVTSVGAASSASNPKIKLTYNSSGNLTDAVISTSSQTQTYDTFNAANSNGTLTFAEKTSDSSDFALGAEPAATALGWKYQTFAVWTDPNSGTGNYGSISAGAETQATNIPTTSTVSFSGYGSGFQTDASNNVYFAQLDVTATANFATRGIYLASSNTGKQQYTGSWGAYVNDSNLNFSGNLAYGPNSNSVTGTLTTASGLTGPVNARFYGPHAQELGGVFNLTGAGQTFVGAFGAEQ